MSTPKYLLSREEDDNIANENASILHAVQLPLPTVWCGIVSGYSDLLELVYLPVAFLTSHMDGNYKVLGDPDTSLSSICSFIYPELLEDKWVLHLLDK